MELGGFKGFLRARGIFFEEFGGFLEGLGEGRGFGVVVELGDDGN